MPGPNKTRQQDKTDTSPQSGGVFARQVPGLPDQCISIHIFRINIYQCMLTGSIHFKTYLPDQFSIYRIHTFQYIFTGSIQYLPDRDPSLPDQYISRILVFEARDSSTNGGVAVSRSCTASCIRLKGRGTRRGIRAHRDGGNDVQEHDGHDEYDKISGETT